MSVQTLIQIRRGSSTQWANTNPTLSSGEWGYETDSGRYKVGDGLTAWNSLDYASVTPDSFSAGTGIGLTAGTNGSTLAIAVTGITSSLVTDFNSAVSGIVTGISVSTEDIMDIVGTGLVGASGIGIDYQDNNNQIVVNVTGISSSQVNDFNSAVSAIVATGALSAEEVMDIVGTGIIAGSYVGINYSDVSGTITIDVTGVAASSHSHSASNITDFNSAVSGLLPSVTGGSGISVGFSSNIYTVSLSDPTIQSTDITDFNSAVSGLLPITDLTEGTGVGISNVGTNYTIAITGIPSSLITDFNNAIGNVVDTSLVDGTGIGTTYNSGTNELTISVTGIPLSLVNDVTASSTEVNYLDGSIPGTGVASKAVVLDATKSITGIGSITTTGNVTVGGDLIVQGTTTTVNSTVVEIGDNIIRVNTSGLNTGGLEVYTGATTKSLIWDNVDTRWEFDGNVYTTGNFIGNLTGNADTVTSGVYTYQTGVITSTMILNETIVDADISSSAAINVQKLASGSTGQVLQVSSTGIIWAGIDGGTP